MIMVVNNKPKIKFDDFKELITCLLVITLCLLIGLNSSFTNKNDKMNEINSKIPVSKKVK